MLDLWGRTIRPFVEHHFSMFLLGAFFIGLVVPDISFIPKVIVPSILAVIILVSCSKIKLEDFKKFRARDVVGFVALRFIVIPGVFFVLARAMLPEYTLSLLMLALLPCGATLAALMSVVGGSAGLGLTATTLTSMLAPLSIPVAFAFLSGVHVEINILGMFITLILTVICPVIVYFGFVRRFERVKLSLRRNSSALSCLLICINVVIVVSYQQDKFFEGFGFLLQTLLVGGGAYLLFYVVGWFFFMRGDKKQKVSYSLMSGNNNINLGISLAVLFLPDFESIVLVLWELNWILGLVCFQLFVRHRVDDVG